MGGKSLAEAGSEVVSYAISFGSFYLFVWLGRRWLDRGVASPAGPWARLVQTCVTGGRGYKRVNTAAPDEQSGADDARPPPPAEPPRALSFFEQALQLGVCALGIQVSYLCWGVMQETIMTTRYSNGEMFTSSKFLVFANRIIALFVAAAAMWWQQRKGGDGFGSVLPLYRFSYCSVSNIVSSVCQYEALKFVSFPTQVLAKSSKMVPVMLMGYLVSRKRYPAVDYVVACGVTAGVALFKLYERSDAPEKDTQLMGIVLILIYLGADSFTSNWQSRLFKEAEVSSMAMMCYVNLFSSLFTLLSLFVNAESLYVARFVATAPELMRHVVLMAVCSAVGQLFIFHTIKAYGPLVFATIQTVRQFLSVVLSLVLFAHPVNGAQCVGIVLVFASLGGQIGMKARARLAKPPPAAPAVPSEMAPATEMRSGDEGKDGR